MRVSVVIPAFNDQPGVNTCLDAISSQTYPRDRVEVIVVDNGSTPPLSLDRTYPFSVHLIRCAIPGSYAARNAGARAATGEVLAFVDADCWPDLDWLARGVSSLMTGDGRLIIGGEVSVIMPYKPSAVALYQCSTGFGQEANVRIKGFAATANLFCARTVFDEVGPFDARLLSGGDREWCWRAARRGVSIRYEPEAVVNTRPRVTLREAFRQARRVVAGRRMLRKLGLAHIGDAAVAKRRSMYQALTWILSDSRLTIWQRLRVVYAAALIRVLSAAESWRLALGASAERR